MYDHDSNVILAEALIIKREIEKLATTIKLQTHLKTEKWYQKMTQWKMSDLQQSINTYAAINLNSKFSH